MCVCYIFPLNRISILFYVFDMLFKINAQPSKQSHTTTNTKQNVNNKKTHTAYFSLQNILTKPECNRTKAFGLNRRLEIIKRFWLWYRNFLSKIILRISIQRPCSYDGEWFCITYLQSSDSFVHVWALGETGPVCAPEWLQTENWTAKQVTGERLRPLHLARVHAPWCNAPLCP